MHANDTTMSYKMLAQNQPTFLNFRKICNKNIFQRRISHFQRAIGQTIQKEWQLSSDTL